uniref:NADH-ubiquinone oxidoreductase chain 5 n=1 Tax=Stenodactylus petrii TaxID=401535 RepID=A0A0A1HAN0_9SAUR|nr:NADH dehydrogenase subunit 5 [Stenodactylus petrii]
MNTLFHTAFWATIMILLLPLFFPSLATIANIIRLLKVATKTSTLALFLFLCTGMQTITTKFQWYIIDFTLEITITHDIYTTTFLPIALFISRCILEFTRWYMETFPHAVEFTMHLLLFLLTMLILISSSNMIQIFIGWEGVGIMSFLLIGWWFSRTSANTSALQAIIYNRIGDMGLMMTMAWLAMNYNTWELEQIFSHNDTHTLPLLGLILAAMGKSAQFGLHPWLPAAMEGPTPVSALLHSSTMVVAGIFLLVRLAPALTQNQTALSLCLILGAMTTTFAALCATTQNDIKKIIAFSTSSQLGLMMLTIGLNQPNLAFLHILTHAFFKAMLFLCAGSIIHNLNAEQDIRKMGGLQKTMPLTTSCLTIGSIALAGIPYLAGFYTKDAILENMMTSPINAWALLTTIIATALTAAYSTRLIIYVHLSTPRYLTIQQPNEDNSNQIQPIMHLAIGSIISGLCLTTMILPTEPHILTMPTTIKLLTIIATTLGFLSTLDMHRTLTLLPPCPQNIYTATTQLAFFNMISHRYLPTSTTTMAQTKALQLNDMLWYETLAPMMMATANQTLAKTLSSTHTATVKTHLTSFISMTLLALLMMKLGHSQGPLLPTTY